MGDLPRSAAKQRGILHVAYSTFHEFCAKRLVDRYTAINEATRGYLRSIGILADRIELRVPDTILADRALIESAPKGAARRELGIPEGVPIVLSVGRLEPETAFDELIRTFARSGVGRLVILGGGILRPRLEALVRELGVEGTILLPGRKDRRDIWKYYKDADAFVLLSKVEALGLVFWEAMYMNVPVIGRPIGGIKETIGEDGLRGFFWDTSNGPAAFGEKLERCIARGPKIEAMVGRAHAYVVGKINTRSGGSSAVVR